MNNNYYIVEAKCGHVGKDKYILIKFPIKASSKKEAATKARLLPRVKHHHKDAIRDVREVDYDAFASQIEENKYNTYLNVSNIQEQREYYSDYYLDREEEQKLEKKEKAKTLSFSLVKQLLAYQSYYPKEYKEMKSLYLCQSHRIMQN